ncbi:MAG: lysylphosphatidylglycerol synthase transmembrane domain-containing protein, partial [Candidatus Krumholzibacteria bacterium]|nr:lysylphosphatidylglycerol synthase transmembrane domain-containing protein [Candidatus Krumholzibacteria bacterium]
MKRKLILGIVISAVFLFFALRNVDPGEMRAAFAAADYRYVLPAVCLTLISLWFRSVRWRYLLNPVKQIGRRSLLSAASIGLMANSVLPVRLGEFVRAYVIGRKERISKSSAFATIVVERIIDGVTVLAFFVAVVLRSPRHYPGWLQTIAYVVAGD